MHLYVYRHLYTSVTGCKKIISLYIYIDLVFNFLLINRTDLKKKENCRGIEIKNKT